MKEEFEVSGSGCVALAIAAMFCATAIMITKLVLAAG